MNGSSIRHFAKLAIPVDRSIAAVLGAVDAIARAHGYQYLLVGAAARHILLVNVLGLRTARATRDLDFGLLVKDWSQFDSFKESLTQQGSIRADRKHPQRLYHRTGQDEWETPIDLIPFGPIASADGTVAWPPEGDIVINVAGFEEASRAAVLVTIDKDVTVRVASLPGLATLKFMAWLDRHRENNKDATDLYTLLSTYADAGNTDRLYGDEIDVAESTGFDIELAGAQLLGRDVARSGKEECLRAIEGLLESKQLAGELAAQIQQVNDPFGDTPTRIEGLLERFRRGLRESR